jgi:hypothetical protein
LLIVVAGLVYYIYNLKNQNLPPKR